MITFANDTNANNSNTSASAEAQDVRRGSGLAAVFLTRYVLSLIIYKYFIVSITISYHTIIKLYQYSRIFSTLNTITITIRDRFVVLDKFRQVLVRNFKNETIKVTTPPLAGTYVSVTYSFEVKFNGMPCSSYFSFLVYSYLKKLDALLIFPFTTPMLVYTLHYLFFFLYLPFLII